MSKTSSGVYSDQIGVHERAQVSAGSDYLGGSHVRVHDCVRDYVHDCVHVRYAS